MRVPFSVTHCHYRPWSVGHGLLLCCLAVCYATLQTSFRYNTVVYRDVAVKCLRWLLYPQEEILSSAWRAWVCEDLDVLESFPAQFKLAPA